MRYLFDVLIQDLKVGYGSKYSKLLKMLDDDDESVNDLTRKLGES